MQKNKGKSIIGRGNNKWEDSKMREKECFLEMKIRPVGLGWYGIKRSERYAGSDDRCSVSHTRVWILF